MVVVWQAVQPTTLGIYPLLNEVNVLLLSVANTLLEVKLNRHESALYDNIKVELTVLEVF
jgi:hypothetical protein